jgi:hypothetical protein
LYVRIGFKEQAEGRLPLDIEFHHVELPDVLKQKLVISKDAASKEGRGPSAGDVNAAN